VKNKTENGYILIVDDSPESLKFLTDVVEESGASVLVALNGTKALEVIKEIVPDAILMDAVMPGMDGPTWVREALKQRPDVKVVFVSGYAEGAFGDSQAEIPNAIFLPKPFSLNQLTNTVYQQLNPQQVH